MHKKDKKNDQKSALLVINSKFTFLPPYSSSIHCSAMMAKSKKLTILSLLHKALHMLDSLYDKRINLALLLAG